MWNKRGDSITSFKANRETGLLSFTEQCTPVGTPSIVTFLSWRKRVGESGALIVGVLKVELVELGLEQFLVWQMSLVLGDERGGQGAAERIFHDLVVLAGAQQQTDRR